MLLKKLQQFQWIRTLIYNMIFYLLSLIDTLFKMTILPFSKNAALTNKFVLLCYSFVVPFFLDTIKINSWLVHLVTTKLIVCSKLHLFFVFTLLMQKTLGILPASRFFLTFVFKKSLNSDPSHWQEQEHSNTGAGNVSIWVLNF